MNDSPDIFDRRLLRRRRDRAAATFCDYDFLFREAAERLADRLEDITRKFPLALDLGCHDGTLARAIGARGGIETLVQSDCSIGFCHRAAPHGPATLVSDEEALPFAAQSFDLVLSLLNLHWVNDLPGTLLQIRQILKPDGLLLVALLGGDTLQELRSVLLQAESEIEGGASPRVSPFADIRDLGGLLQRAGFALPVVDSDSIPVTYGSALTLMAELRAMGESNLLRDRLRRPTRRSTLLRAAELYQQTYADADGRLPVTFQVITMTAWAPHASQQQPLKPGSAQTRLADALSSEEYSAGDKANPKG